MSLSVGRGSGIRSEVKGGGTPGYVAYGATKRGLPQMTDSLVKELEDPRKWHERDVGK